MLKRLPEGERVNTITHALGCLISIVGGIALVARSVGTGDPWRIAGCIIFSFSLIAVYAASTLSHAFAQAELRRFFRILDQGLIYLLIVGSYTPWSFTYLRTPFWWGFLGVMWAIALWGLTMKMVIAHRIEAVTLWSYVLLGWMTVIPMIALVGTLPWSGPAWVLAGGICYTAGTIFFVWDNPRYHCHGMWHVAVIAGSFCHWAGVYFYVAVV